MLKKTDEICLTLESTTEQMKAVEENPKSKQVNAINQLNKREPCGAEEMMVWVSANKGMWKLWNTRHEEERKLSSI